MTLYSGAGAPVRPEPRITERFVITRDVGHVREELALLGKITGVRVTLSEPERKPGPYNPAIPPELEVELYGRERDVVRYMDAVKKWSAAGKKKQEE